MSVTREQAKKLNSLILRRVKTSIAANSGRGSTTLEEDRLLDCDVNKARLELKYFIESLIETAPPETP